MCFHTEPLDGTLKNVISLHVFATIAAIIIIYQNTIGLTMISWIASIWFTAWVITTYHFLQASKKSYIFTKCLSSCCDRSDNSLCEVIVKSLWYSGWVIGNFSLLIGTGSNNLCYIVISSGMCSMITILSSYHMTYDNPNHNHPAFLYPLKLAIIWFTALFIVVQMEIQSYYTYNIDGFTVSSIAFGMTILNSSPSQVLSLYKNQIFIVFSLIGFVYTFCRHAWIDTKKSYNNCIGKTQPKKRNKQSDNKNNIHKSKHRIGFAEIVSRIMRYSDYFVIINAVVTCIGTSYQLLRVIPLRHPGF